MIEKIENNMERVLIKIPKILWRMVLALFVVLIC
jgi:hypothetical protein